MGIEVQQVAKKCLNVRFLWSESVLWAGIKKLHHNYKDLHSMCHWSSNNVSSGITVLIQLHSLYKIMILGRTNSFCCTVRSFTVGLNLRRTYKFSPYDNKKHEPATGVIVKCCNNQTCKCVFRLEVVVTQPL
jgi:hypothetical protein